MHSQKNVLDKVDTPLLKEYIKTVRDPLRSPPIPLAKKEARDALEYQSQFKNKELRTQARFRQGVNKMIQNIIKEKIKINRSDIVKKEVSVEGSDRTSMRYSGMVKLGNWEAERAWAEEEMGRFLRLRNRQELGVQKTRELFSEALLPITVPPKERLEFGKSVQLIAPRASTFEGRGAARGLALSAVLESGVEGAVLSGSPLLAPCSRNVFQLCPLEEGAESPAGGGRASGPLRYGQVFGLRYTGTSKDQPYYVSVLPHRVIPVGNSSRHPQVHLSSRQSWSAGWTVMPPSRLGTAVGKEVPVGSDLVVLSAVLNRTLAAETDCWFSTIFGLECEATAYEYPVGDRNVWCIL